MKVITVSPEETFLHHLLTTIVDDGLILQTTDGHRFMVCSLEGWEGFDVGESDDFEQEVDVTGQNTKLLAFLAKRQSHGKRIPLDKLKEELGLDE
jgi:hypothetical protein